MTAQHKKYILVVEDEEDLLYSMKLTLIKEGFAVVTAENGRKGLDLFKSAFQKGRPFDLVITDIQMPDMTGIELLMKIQQHAAQTPTLVITGYGDKETVIELMRLGCLDYLDKPFKPDIFVKHVRAALERHSNRQQATDKKIHRLEKEAEDYESQLVYYRNTLEKIEQQFSSAKGAYRELVHIDKNTCPLPVAWKLKQFAELGGDYFDVKHGEQGCDILVADVSGHDMGASYHAVLLKAFFEENARTGNDGNTFFQLLNRQLLGHQTGGRMVTATFIRIAPDFSSGEIVCAGHPAMIRVRPKPASLLSFHLTGDVLGIHQTVRFEKRRFQLKPGDRYFVYTDGILSAPRIDGETGGKRKLSQNGLQQMIRNHRDKPLAPMITAVWDDVLAFCHFKPVDDMLLFGFEIPGNT